MQASAELLHGPTCCACPIACATALAVQDVIRDKDLLANLRPRGDDLSHTFPARLEQRACVGDSRGRGLLQAVAFVDDRGARVA